MARTPHTETASSSTSSSAEPETFEHAGAYVELGADGAWAVYHDPRSAGDARRLARRGKADDKEAARAHVLSMLPRFGFTG